MEIKEQLQRIEKSLLQLSTGNRSEDELMTVTEAAAFLHLAESTIYAKVCRSEIPVIKRGKRLYFEKDVLLTWLKEGRRKTGSEVREKVDEYFGRFRSR